MKTKVPGKQELSELRMGADLVVEAGTEVMRNNKEMVSPLCAIPVRPFSGNELDGTPHHAGGLKGQGQAILGEITGCVNRSKEPVGLLWVECPHRARQ